MSDTMRVGDNRLKGIDPERLMLVETEEITPLLTLQYADLVQRGRDLWERATQWKAEHKDGVTNDAENGELTAIMKQLRDFISDSGEVHTARKRVKVGPYSAIKAIDGWFTSLSDPIENVLGLGKDAPVGSMQYDQTQYLVAKGKREQAQREEIAKEATKRAEEALQRAREDGSDEAVEQAIAAEEAALKVAQDAAAPLRDLVRSRNALGHMSTLASTWDFIVTDMKKLCLAVAEGRVPVTFVTTNDQAIRLAIRAKQAPIRECEGLEIKQVFSARR